MRWLLAVTALWTLLGLLPLALLTSSSISLSENAMSDEVRERVRTTASVSRVVVEQQMDSLKQLVTAFAQRTQVREAVDEVTSATMRDWLGELKELRDGVSGLIVNSPRARSGARSRPPCCRRTSRPPTGTARCATSARPTSRRRTHPPW
ncbi:hypothetical protein ACFQQB_52205 [Nonomuraea rubra]|uniref:hypothetical protein n=1 Tax=Nonomuraea rubra TaxID=46180 RepID=UPI003615AD16